MAVSPDMPDDGLNTDGKPRIIRYKKPQNEGRKGKMDLDDLKKEVEMDDHQIPLATLCSQLGTDPNLVCIVFFSNHTETNLRIPRTLVLVEL